MRTAVIKWIERVVAVVFACVALAVTIPNISPENGIEGAGPSRKPLAFFLTLALVPLILIFIGGKRFRLNVLGWIVLSGFFFLAILQ